MPLSDTFAVKTSVIRYSNHYSRDKVSASRSQFWLLQPHTPKLYRWACTKSEREANVAGR